MQTKLTPKDFFLHLGATIALYVSTFSLINLAFSIINYIFPDVLSYSFYTSSIAWPISVLIILVPILYLIEFFVSKDIVVNPDKRDLWVRKWRIHLTLFLSGAIIIGDFVTLINVYLNGEITARFIYKVVSILIIIGIIFAYYLRDRQRSVENLKISAQQKVIAWIGIILVLGLIIGGFMIVGSPSHMRAVRFDESRISDLTNIQWLIVNNWQNTGKLPANLGDLRDSISGVSIPTDPETGTQYEYNVKSTTSFELCATFSEQSQVNNVKSDPRSTDNWSHTKGKTCFERNIDPLKYPVNSKKI